MTIDDIADFCEFKECEVTLGDPEAGFIQIDGNGVKRRNNYQRYLSFNELAALPSPRTVLEKAALFRIHEGDQVRTLSREEFERELHTFRKKVGVE